MFVFNMCSSEWIIFMIQPENIISESQNEKKYLLTCAPGEYSDQPAHARSSIRIISVIFWIAKGTRFLQAERENCDQSLRMRRMIWLFNVRTCSEVHFSTLRSICFFFLFEPAHDKTDNKTCAISEDSDQPAHPRSLIRIFADRMCLL